ncbi:MAG: CvpA family protein [candidate division WOR-3 bacterium]|nr:CvpA family protein [candidate division WOR-3 bacterium]MDH5684696.1 CvpA family protein [candidate division WOR-3 bacterium]
MVVNLVIIVVIAIFVIFGLRQGFIRWLAVTLGIVIGFWMASQKYFVLEKLFGRIFHSQYQAQVVGFILVFLVFFFILVLLGYLLRKIMNLVMLGWLDRLLGGIFGLINGLVFVWLLLALIVSFQPSLERHLSKSVLATQILEAGRRLSGLQLKQRLQKKYLTLRPEGLSLIPQVNISEAQLKYNLQFQRSFRISPKKSGENSKAFNAEKGGTNENICSTISDSCNRTSPELSATSRDQG